MNYLIHGREPASVFRFFEEICAIPHPSYHEERIADYLEAFAAERGLDCYRDEQHNVLIKKPATPDRASDAPILLQGHTDMVCEKNGDVEHDFLTDPLKLFLDGEDLLGARGTTLGGDDGIAVAIMLAVLDGALVSHPPVECLFTVAEEVGLNGAHGFDYDKISARRMVNLDSEDLGVVTAGCAGGLRSDLSFDCTRVPLKGDAIRICVKGLVGGHSGVDINRGRANANKWMGRLLAKLGADGVDWNLISLVGGSKDNAIPRECEAVIAVRDIEAAVASISEGGRALASEWSIAEPRAAVVTDLVAAPATMFTKEDSLRITAVLDSVQNGVREMNQSIEGLVEWSRNLGVITTENDTVTLIFSARSGIESRLDASIAELDALAGVVSCRAHHHSRYPGWEYAPVSPLRDAYCDAYRNVTGQTARVDVIHAGLECGIIYSKLPDMDIISVGPDMRDIHSPAERLSLSSVETFWKTLAALIEKL